MVERKDALDRLSSSLVARSEEVERNMRSLIDTVDGAFTQAATLTSNAAGTIDRELKSSVSDVDSLIKTMGSISDFEAIEEPEKEVVED